MSLAASPTSSGSTTPTAASTPIPASTSAPTSTSSGWYSSLKAAANVASATAAKAANAVATQTRQTYEYNAAQPTTMQCTGCGVQLQVPSNIFDWEYDQKHINPKAATNCQICALIKPKQTEPSLTCPQCHVVSTIPLTNASKAVREAALNTRKFVVNTAAATKQQINYLRASPDTFHCAFCNTLLAVPTGPWVCQNCTVQNAEDVQKCKHCPHLKSQQKAICGVCRQPTAIPTTNLYDSLRYKARDLTQSTRKIYMTLANKPFVTCGRCGAHVSLPSKPNEAGAAIEGVNATSEGSAPTPAQSEVLQNLQCPSCKNQIEPKVNANNADASANANQDEANPAGNDAIPSVSATPSANAPPTAL